MTSDMNLKQIIGFIVIFGAIFEVCGHGRLMWPPARGTVFRHKQFSYLRPTANYGDHELNCGGREVQWNQNAGKCGVCGDNFALESPRPNESGGKYDSYILVAQYNTSEEIDVHVQLTANHGGFFEFRLCEHNNPGTPEEEACFDKHVLEVVVNGSTSTRPWEKVFPNINDYHLKLKLPEGITCYQCVLQWNYLAAQSWDACKDGSWEGGCETFRGCADIMIGPTTLDDDIYDETYENSLSEER